MSTMASAYASIFPSNRLVAEKALPFRVIVVSMWGGGRRRAAPRRVRQRLCLGRVAVEQRGVGQGDADGRLVALGAQEGVDQEPQALRRRGGRVRQDAAEQDRSAPPFIGERSMMTP